MKQFISLGLALVLLGGSTALAQSNDEVRGTPHWSRGDRLPAEYRGDNYAVSDWQTLHLRKPARGYHWVRVGDRYMLAAIASGAIRDVILENQIKH